MEETCFNGLLGLLSREKEILLNMLSASSRKKAAVISGDIELLRRFVQEEEALTEELGRLEEDRAALSESLTRSLGINGRVLSLTELAGCTEDPEIKKDLLSVRDELTGLVGIQKKSNCLNRELIRRKQKYTTEMLGALLHSEQADSVYNCSGTIGAGTPGAGLFDRSV